jgi:hypothetical protein
MRPLSLIAGGLALVVLDFRTESLDLLPDPIGWVLVAVACSRLGLVGASWLAVLAGVLSVSDAALPYRYVRFGSVSGEGDGPSLGAGVEPSVQHVFDPVSGWRLAGMALAMVVAGVALWLLLRGLERRADGHGEADTVSRLRLGRWLVAAVWVLPYLVAVGRAVVVHSGTFDPVWNGGAEYVALAGLVVVAYVVVLLAVEADAAWAQPEVPWYPSPWDQLRLRRAVQRPSTDQD